MQCRADYSDVSDINVFRSVCLSFTLKELSTKNELGII